MDDSTIIRAAHHDDVPSLVSLLLQLFTIEDDFVMDAHKQMQGLQLLLETPNTTVLVAQKDDILVGMVTMQQLVSTAMGERVGLIEDMIVHSDFRGQGIGTLLMDSLISLSKQLSYERLSLAVDVRNAPAISFYTRYTFASSNMGLMYKNLTLQ